MKNSLIVLFVFFCQNHLLTAQTNVEKVIIGTVISGTSKLEGISVINCMNKTMAATDKEGCFSILAKEGDILNFSGIDYKYLKKYVYKHDYSSGTMEVDMVFNSVELDEVIINENANINAKNSGMISDGYVRFTPQKRRLYSSQGMFSSVFGDDKTLKMNVEIEKKELLINKLDYLFEDKYYTKTLKIPEELIKGFQYYCVEDARFVESLNNKNKSMSKFLMTNLAIVYNQKRVSEE